MSETARNMRRNPVAVSRHAGQMMTAVNGGRDDRVLNLAPRRRTAFLREAMMDSYQELSRRHEFIAIAGCGSPVELNLCRRDVSDLRLANLIKAPCLLVASVTNTAVFGTLSLTRPFERERVIGLVVSRYMGDPRDFISGMRILESRSGAPRWGRFPITPGSASSALDHSERAFRLYKDVGAVASRAHALTEIGWHTGNVDVRSTRTNNRFPSTEHSATPHQEPPHSTTSETPAKSATGQQIVALGTKPFNCSGPSTAMRTSPVSSRRSLQLAKPKPQ